MSLDDDGPASPAGGVFDAADSSLHPVVLGRLRPCPFCGAGAIVEPDPWRAGSIRVACGNGACRVAPRTEYLLPCFAGELRAAWNGRPEREA